MILNQYTIPAAGQNVRGGLPMNSTTANAAADQNSIGGSAYRFNQYASGPDAALSSAVGGNWRGGSGGLGMRPAPVVGGSAGYSPTYKGPYTNRTGINNTGSGGSYNPTGQNGLMMGNVNQAPGGGGVYQQNMGGPPNLPGAMGGGWGGQGSQSGGGGTYQGGQASGQSGGLAGIPTDIQGLVSKQLSENDWAKQQNIKGWEQGKAGVQGAVAGLANDPYRTGAMEQFKALSQPNALMQGMQGMAQGLLANPESINDQTQQKIQNQAAGTVNAQFNQRKQALLRQLQAGGQMGGSAAQAALAQLERERAAAIQQGQTGLEIQRAQNRAGDIRAALGAAGGVQGQGFGQQMGANQAMLGGAQQMGMANLGAQESLLANTPQYRPDDYAGLIGALAQFRQPTMTDFAGMMGQAARGQTNFVLPNGQTTSIPGLDQQGSNWMQNLMNTIGQNKGGGAQHLGDQGIANGNAANPYGSWWMQGQQQSPTSNFYGAAEAPMPRPVQAEVDQNFQGWRGI